MSRTPVTLEVAGTVIYSQAAKSRVDQLSITIQNPPSNSGNVEIAWDDVSDLNVTNRGIVLAPGGMITLGGLPVNAAGNVGIVGRTIVAPPMAVRVLICAPTQP
jgi:hypothetical protein